MKDLIASGGDHHYFKAICRQLPTAMMMLIAHLSLAFFAAIFATNSYAASVRVDDSGSVVSQSVVPMRWKQIAPGRGADHSVEASLKVALRLNLAKWLNQPVRLYIGLSSVSSEPVYASWRTQGRLTSGNVRSGERALIFNGINTATMLEETIDLDLKTDGRALTSAQALQFYFEIDKP